MSSPQQQMPPQAPSPPPASPPSNGGSSQAGPSHFFHDIGEEWGALSTPGKLIAIGGLIGAVIAVWLIARRGGFGGGGGSLPVGLSTQQTGGGAGTFASNAPTTTPAAASPIVNANPIPSAPPQWFRGIPGATVNSAGIRFDPNIGGYSETQAASLFGINPYQFQDIPGAYSAFVTKTQPALTIPLGDLPSSPAANIQSIG